MKFLRTFIVIALIFTMIPQGIVFAEGTKVENDLAGVSSQRVKLLRPVKSGLYYISFDMLAEDSSADVYCRLIGNGGQYHPSNNTNLYDAAAFKTWTRAADKVNQPVFTVFGEMTCNWDMEKPANSMTPYNENEWYDVDIWLDFNKRISTVYLNGEYFDTSKMQDKLIGLYGFAFYCNTKTNEGNNGDNTKTFFRHRNLKYGQITDDYIDEEIEGVTIPQYLKNSVDADITTKNPGHIFFTPDNIPFDIAIKNKSGKSKSYNVSYEAFSEGQSVWKSTETVEVGKDKTVTESVSMKIEKPDKQYGFFDFKVIVTDTATGETIERNTRFSVAKKSERVNNKVGVNHHYSRRYYEKGMNNALEIFHNGGIGAERDGLGWTGYEISEGEFKLADKLETWLDTAKEKDSKIVAILGYYNDMYKDLYPEGEVAAPPVDGEYMEKWKLYVENVVRDTIDRVTYYEVYNEWNLSHCNNGKEHYTPHPPEDYVKLAKATYEIIDKVNKEKGTNAKVLVGALGYNSGDGTNDFIQACMDLGICDYADGISAHPYWAHENPENNNYYSTLIAIREIKDALKSRNINDMEIVLTELGYPTRENGSVNEIDQAKWMVRSSAYYEGEVELITWYLGEEKMDNTETEKSFGIIRQQMGTEIPFEAKPAFIALANYNSLLAGAELISRTPEINDRVADGSYINNEQYTYHFKNDGKDIYMLTTMDTKGGVLTLKADNVSVAELIDMYGNSSIIECGADGVFKVPVKNDEPVYILPITENAAVTSGMEIKEVHDYSDDYTFKKESDEYFALGDGGKHLADLSQTPVSKGIVDVSYKFKPHMEGVSPDLKTATQTFEFGEGFSFNAQWTSYGGAAWFINSRFNVGDQSKMMNSKAWNSANNKGWFRPQGYEPTAHYDISAKINLDTKKIYLTINEHLEMKSGEALDTKILDNAEYDYNADTFDFYRISLSTEGNTYLQSLNSSLEIKADGEAVYDKTETRDVYTYPENYIFRDSGNEYIALENGEEQLASLAKTPISEGVVDVSYRFWPNMSTASEHLNEATQTFEFGDGFSFDAKWKSYGGGAWWLLGGKFNVGGINKSMNPTAWNADEGMFRTKDANSTAPHAYYDISAKINLDTSKIYLTIIEHLETTTDKKITTILDNAEYDYNSDVFDYYRTGLTSADPLLQSLNNRLIIKADGKVAHGGFDVKDAVSVKYGKSEIADFAEFNGADRVSVNLTAENTDINGVIVVAYFDKGNLVTIDKIKDVAIGGEYKNINYNYSFEKESVDADSVKIFAWNGMDNLVPVKQMTWLK